MLVYLTFNIGPHASANSSATALMPAIFTQRCEWRKEIKTPSFDRGVRVWHLLFEASLDVGA